MPDPTFLTRDEWGGTSNGWPQMTLPATNLWVLVERITARVEVGNCGCWIWSGQNNGKYGMTKWPQSRRNVYVHRVILAAKLGLEHPDDLDGLACHSCDRPLCCHPSHLHLGTPASNSREMVDRGRVQRWRAALTHCKRGHEFTDENVYRHSGRRHCRTCRAGASR